MKLNIAVSSAKAPYKLCLNCLQPKPQKTTTRKCKQCGGNRFRLPTGEELEAEQAKTKRVTDIINKMNLDN